MCDGDDISGRVKDVVCGWKQILSDNYEGFGTSFDPNNLNEVQKACVRCDGLEYNCKMYVKGERE